MYYFFILFFLFSFSLLGQEEGLTFYKSLKQDPSTLSRLRKEPLYKTKNLTRSPFMMTVEKAKKQNKSLDEKNYHYSGTTVKEEGMTDHTLRILIKNPTRQNFSDFTLVIQHFILDCPERRSKSATGVSTRRSKKSIPFKVETFKLPPLKGLGSHYFDTPPLSLEFKKRGFIDDAYDRKHRRLDDTYITETGLLYGGYILSLFQNSKLSVQVTNKKSLIEKGLTQIPKERSTPPESD